MTKSRVEENRKKFGPNVLQVEKKRTLFNIIISQLNSPLVYILIIAGFLMLFLDKTVDSIIVFTVVILNTIIGTVQEGKAEDTLGALKKAVKSYAKVIRDGKEITVEDSELVVGDIIVLKDGSIVPADARLIETNSLKVNQSALTGEAELIEKNFQIIDVDNLDFNEQDNMLFRGTYVVSGLAKAVVVRTGIDTLIGQISAKLRKIESEIPLKGKIREISHFILIVVAIISAILLFVGLRNGNDFWEMLLVVVAVAVSAIPEGLPVVVTLVLASGVWRMSQKKVLVKRLQAVEALGQAKIIAVDKTGTITKNQMAVGKFFVNNRIIEVTGDSYGPIGDFIENGKKINLNKGDGVQILSDRDLDLFGKISTFTATADFNRENKNDWRLESGDPTEAALKILGIKMGMEKDVLESRFPKEFEIPFNMDNKFHATVNKINDDKLFSVAGSPESILQRCDTVWENNERRELTKERLDHLEYIIDDFSKEGYRILALAANFKPGRNFSEKNIPTLTLIGFVAISDAIREEVYDAVKQARGANMKVVMITGDHAKTAEAIAKKVGIFHKGDKVITGKDIRSLKTESLAKILKDVTVFARVSPDDKLRIIEAFKMNGDIVAMTGDGINDALSLVAADLGVAMGQSGTEVAREAADLVLVDDNFGNIIEAAEEGRNIYWIIRKSISFLLSTNVGELLTITAAVLIGLPLPLLATQIIWLNLVTDGFLVVPLSMDPREKNIMSEIYRRPNNNIVDRLMIVRILIVGVLMAAVTLVLFTVNVGGEMERAWTISLTMLTVFQWMNIYNVKSHQRTIFSKETFNNKYLVYATIFAISLHLFAIYTPFMQNILRTTSLGLVDWMIIIPLGLLIIFTEEIRKFIYRSFFLKLRPKQLR